MGTQGGDGAQIPEEAARSRSLPSEPARVPGRERPTCRCGHDRTHTMVSPSADYTMIGWAFILVGVSWEPTCISFVCRACDEVVERVRDPKEMAQIRLAG